MLGRQEQLTLDSAVFDEVGKWISRVAEIEGRILTLTQEIHQAATINDPPTSATELEALELRWSGSRGGSHPSATIDLYVTVSRNAALVALISWQPV